MPRALANQRLLRQGRNGICGHRQHQGSSACPHTASVTCTGAAGQEAHSSPSVRPQGNGAIELLPPPSAVQRGTYTSVHTSRRYTGTHVSGCGLAGAMGFLRSALPFTPFDAELARLVLPEAWGVLDGCGRATSKVGRWLFVRTNSSTKLKGSPLARNVCKAQRAPHCGWPCTHRPTTAAHNIRDERRHKRLPPSTHQTTCQPQRCSSDNTTAAPSESVTCSPQVSS